MSRGYQSRLFPSFNKETKAAEKIAKILTEDFALDLERVGFYLVQNHPSIVYHRFDVLVEAAQEEYDKVYGERRKLLNDSIRR